MTKGSHCVSLASQGGEKSVRTAETDSQEMS
jgi:hypothetical protein